MKRGQLKYNAEQTIRLLGQIAVDSKLFNLPGLMQLRDLTYRLLFGCGKGFHCGHNVFIDREHQQFTGSISIGNECFVSHDVHLDYTGHLVIGDSVWILEGTRIITHTHDIQALRQTGKNATEQMSLTIGDRAYIGSNVTILPSCHYIGADAIIGAGAVVTHDVADGIMVAGIPAKILKKVSVWGVK